MKAHHDIHAYLSQAQSAVGAMGFPILCEVVREEHKDVELLRTALECLANAFTAPAHGSGMQQQVRLLPDLQEAMAAISECAFSVGSKLSLSRH